MSVREINLDDRQVALISKALADPSRFEMLQRIGASEVAPTCSCLRDWLDLAPATISHHLKELETAGLIAIEREGKFAHISVRRNVLQAYIKHLGNI